MTRISFLTLSSLIAISTAATTLNAQTPLGTAFTYQGQLKSAGSPASGPLTMQFKLFDGLTGGNQVGPTLSFDGVSNPQVSVTNGLFTVPLDFGAGAFHGENRWLEIAISDITLTPRQALTAAPNALYAKNNWALNGNAGTNPASDFVGTSDNQPLTFKVNNLRAMQYQYGDNGYSQSINVLGGANNNTIADWVLGATIGGGGEVLNNEPNQVSAHFGTISGGVNNTVSDYAATISGGESNTSSGVNSVVAGGQSNTAAGPFGSVGGGSYNSNTGGSATIGGGDQNSITSDLATIGGGALNTATGMWSTIAGGVGNIANGQNATVGGGYYNIAETVDAVGGGADNVADGGYSTVSGGQANIAGGFASSIPGGSYNSSSGSNSFAAGFRARADHNGAFVWADLTGGDFSSTAANQFLIRASGGVGIGTTTPGDRLSIMGGALSFEHPTNAVPYVGMDYDVASDSLRFRTNINSSGLNSTALSIQRTTGRTYVDPLGFGGTPAISLAVGDTDTGFNSAGDGMLDIYSQNVNTMSIRSGNVGIGTTAPTNRLSVSGNAEFSGNVAIGTPSPTGKLTIASDRQDGAGDPAHGIMFNDSLAGGFGHAAIYSDGAVGYNGNLVFATDGDSAQNFNPTEKMRIRYDGNVGIGTASPSQRLTVAGNICATGTIGACSDARFKEHVEPVASALEKVEHLRGVTFDWKRGEFKDHQFAEGRQIGFIAQEVEKVLPLVVAKGSDGYLSVDYGRLTPVLVEAIKQVKSEHDHELAALRSENAELKVRLERLENAVNGSAH